MKSLTFFLITILNFTAFCQIRFVEDFCTSDFNDQAKVYELTYKNQLIGYSFWINRSNKRIKAKYFTSALSGKTPFERYNQWKQGKKVLLFSSGAYSTAFNSSAVPVGITIDEGIIINSMYEEKLGCLVIIEKVGGIRSVDINSRKIDVQYSSNRTKASFDIKNSWHRSQFMNWAKLEQATVFQTHLLISNNKNVVGKYNSDKDKTIRKVLVLLQTNYGQIFHVLYYFSDINITLYDVAEGILENLSGKNYSILAAFNLDTGNYDIISSGYGLKDCSGNYLSGTVSERSKMSNILTYYFD